MLCTTNKPGTNTVRVAHAELFVHLSLYSSNECKRLRRSILSQGGRGHEQRDPSLFLPKVDGVDPADTGSSSYAKGRDWYDLLWYLARQIEPNLTLLSHGLSQTGPVYCAEARNWREGVDARLSALDWNAVVQDVRPFLEEVSELDAFSPDLIRSMLGF